MEDAFVGILPGDERTQEIILENTSDRAMDFYMEVEVLRALEEATQASDAAYQFSLSVTQEGVNGGEPQMIYGGGAESQAWIGGDKEGLANINEVLEQYGERGLKVATLEPGPAGSHFSFRYAGRNDRRKYLSGRTGYFPVCVPCK